MISHARAPQVRADTPPTGTDGYSWIFSGRRFVFNGFSDADIDQLRNRYPPVPPSAETRARKTFSVEVHYRHPANLGTPRPLDTACDYDIDYRPSRVELTGHRYRARIFLDSEAHGELEVGSNDKYWLPNVVGNFLNVSLAYCLLDEGGMLMHSSAVVTDSGVLLFIGPSGAGKSTIARLAQDAGRMVLSDDQNALLSGPPYRVRRARLAEDFENSSNHEFPLRAILRLRHGAHNEIRRMSLGEALASLIAHAPTVSADPFRIEGLTRTATAIACAVPVYRLVFRQDAGLWPWLAGEMR